jgi:hypothetical protein
MSNKAIIEELLIIQDSEDEEGEMVLDFNNNSKDFMFGICSTYDGDRITAGLRFNIEDSEKLANAILNKIKECREDEYNEQGE